MKLLHKTLRLKLPEEGNLPEHVAGDTDYVVEKTVFAEEADDSFVLAEEESCQQVKFKCEAKNRENTKIPSHIT